MDNKVLSNPSNIPFYNYYIPISLFFDTRQMSSSSLSALDLLSCQFAQPAPALFRHFIPVVFRSHQVLINILIYRIFHATLCAIVFSQTQEKRRVLHAVFFQIAYDLASQLFYLILAPVRYHHQEKESP